MKRCIISSPNEKQKFIKIIPFDEVGFYRTLIGKKYKFPITLTALGREHKTIGLKAVVFDPVAKTEKGMFFSLETPEVPQRIELTKKKFQKVLGKLSFQYQREWCPPDIVYVSRNKRKNIGSLEEILPIEKSPN